MPDVPPNPRAETRPRMWGAAAAAILGIGWFDYVSGIELRVFALYFAPISLVAWHFGRVDACVASVLCSVTWLVSNALAGQQYSHPAYWVANTLVQAASFVTVGMLIANLRSAIRRERGLSRTDALTDLLNTRAFYEDAGHLLALCRRKGHPVTLAYIDLDDFKVVNDTRGHPAGDGLLRRVADALRTSTRPSDSCARLGGTSSRSCCPRWKPWRRAWCSSAFVGPSPTRAPSKDARSPPASARSRFAACPTTWTRWSRRPIPRCTSPRHGEGPPEAHDGRRDPEGSTRPDEPRLIFDTFAPVRAAFRS